MLLPVSEAILPQTKTTKTSSRSRPLASWDSTRQQRHRASQGLTIHVLLDASGSMLEHADALRSAYNLLLTDLKTFAPPQTNMVCWTFTQDIKRISGSMLFCAPALTDRTYDPGGGTALAFAMSHVLTTEHPIGQQVLIVFTDGTSDEDQDVVRRGTARLKAAQQDGWLCVYLGAYTDALQQGLDYGFHEGNCLVFTKAHLADAFAKLRSSLQRFILAAPAEQRLLSSQGIF